MFESFDPNKYKKVSEMPKEVQPEFFTVDKDGSFVKKTALDAIKKAKYEATTINAGQSVVEKVLGKNELNEMDVLQKDALEEDADRTNHTDKSLFTSVDDSGSFVKKTALEAIKKAQYEATAINAGRSVMQKVIGKNKLSPVDVLHGDAIRDDAYRTNVMKDSPRGLYSRRSSAESREYSETELGPINEAITKKESEVRIRVVEKLATLLHDEWRASRKKEDGTFEPRVKKTKDEVWSKEHGTSEVDIANTDYDNLPDDWKGENKISAEVAVNLVSELARNRRLDYLDVLEDNGFIDMASAEMHVKWLERNGSWASDEQKLPYAELSEEEKEKDRIIIRKAVELYSQQPESILGRSLDGVLVI